MLSHKPIGNMFFASSEKKEMYFFGMQTIFGSSRIDLL